MYLGRTLLKKTLSPILLSNNLSLLPFLLLAYSLLNFNLLESHIAQFRISKSNSFVSKSFIFIRIRCVLNLHPNLRQYQIHNVVSNSESQPKDLYFSKGTFSRLIF